MPNPFHFRAKIDQLWRRADDRRHRGYLRVKALDAIVRELFARNNPRAQANYAMYLATDPFDVARHKLRHLHDRPGSLTFAPTEVAPAQAGAALLQEDELPEEDDDPL